MSSPSKTNLLKKIENGEPLNFTIKYLEQNFFTILTGITAKLLSRMDRIFLHLSLTTILHELLVNSLKANIKRVFFKKNNLNINDPASYDKGMDIFKNRIIGEFGFMKSDLMETDYYIRISLEIVHDNLIISIINNASILPKELERINYRIKKGIEYKEFTDVYDDIEDDMEGAGLGIVLVIFLLINMGIGPENLSIKSDKGITETKLIIKKELRPAQITTKIKNEIINDIEGIPTFPDNILQLQELCNNPDASLALIAEKIITDPALATEVIKFSNSASFVPGKRIETVYGAIKTIGLKNLNTILITSSARRILNERYSNYEEIWEHCNKTAYYARMICTSCITKIADNAFLAGLLHDLGKIILLSTNLDLVKKIAEEVKNRNIISTTIMEEISIGISHSTIGELITSKWNFPDYLIQAIKYHHDPLNAPDELKELVFSVYLANMLCGIEDKMYNYYYLEEDVLQRFDLHGEDKFTEFHNNFKEKYNKILFI